MKLCDLFNNFNQSPSDDTVAVMQ